MAIICWGVIHLYFKKKSKIYALQSLNVNTNPPLTTAKQSAKLHHEVDPGDMALLSLPSWKGLAAPARPMGSPGPVSLGETESRGWPWCKRSGCIWKVSQGVHFPAVVAEIAPVLR